MRSQVNSRQIDLRPAGWPAVLSLVYDAVQECEWKRAAAQEEIPAPVIATLLVYSYASGHYSAAEIEAQAHIEPSLRYICARALPRASQLRSFRRENRVCLEHALAILLQKLNPVLPFNSALAQAKAKVSTAVQFDSFELDV